MRKKLTSVSIIFLAAVAFSAAWAQSDIPNLVGKWKIEAEAGVLIKGEKTSDITHHETVFSTLKAEMVIEKQKSRVFTGYFKSPKATEKIAGVIGLYNKTFYYVDTDGIVDGKIVTPDKLYIIYRHVKPSDSMAAVALATRQE